LLRVGRMVCEPKPLLARGPIAAKAEPRKGPVTVGPQYAEELDGLGLAWLCLAQTGQGAVAAVVVAWFFKGAIHPSLPSQCSLGHQGRVGPPPTSWPSLPDLAALGISGSQLAVQPKIRLDNSPRRRSPGCQTRRASGRQHGSGELARSQPEACVQDLLMADGSIRVLACGRCRCDWLAKSGMVKVEVKLRIAIWVFGPWRGVGKQMGRSAVPDRMADLGQILGAVEVPLPLIVKRMIPAEEGRACDDLDVGGVRFPQKPARTGVSHGLVCGEESSRGIGWQISVNQDNQGVISCRRCRCALGNFTRNTSLTLSCPL
jgi:hypothetical protein